MGQVKSLFTLECILMNVKETMVLANQYLAAIRDTIK